MYSVFSMFSKFTPCSPIRDGKIPKFVEPWVCERLTDTFQSHKFKIKKNLRISYCFALKTLHPGTQTQQTLATL